MGRIRFRLVRRDQVLGDEEANALFENDRALDQAIDALVDSTSSSAAELADHGGTLAAHLADHGNPHAVSAEQIGAAAAEELAEHLAANNPHGITPAAIGAATIAALQQLEARLALHLGDANNPHDTTALQVGAPTVADLAAHLANAVDPHPGFGGGSSPDPDLYETNGPTTLTTGDLVAVDRSLGTGAVILADPSSEERMPAIAMVVGRAGSRVILRAAGRSSLSGLEPGRTYFVGRDGRPSSAPPVPLAGEALFQQEIGAALSPTEIRLSLSPVVFRARG
jgi:hypothetical protein